MMGNYYFYFQPPNDRLFTENETNFNKLNGTGDKSAFTKDAFHDAIINRFG